MAIRIQALAFAIVGSVVLGPSSATTAWAGPPVGPRLARCERAVADAPGERAAWGCFYDHARIAGDWAETAAALRASLADAGSLEDQPRAHGYALLSLANLVAELDTQAAIAIYEDAARELERGGDSLALTLTLLNLAQRHRVVGAPQRSAEVLRAAERAARAHGEDRWIATVEVERVRHVLRSGGDLGQAARLLAEVEALLFPAGDYQAQVNWLNAAASVHRGLGRLDVARSYHDRLVALVQGAGDSYAEAPVRYNRLVVMLDQARRRGDLVPRDELLAEVERAVDAGERGSNHWTTTSLRCMQSEFVLARGRHRAAEALARECLSEARALEDVRLEVDATLAVLHVLLASSELDEQHLAEAESLASTARRRAREGEDPVMLNAALALTAELRWRAGPREDAIAASEALLAAIEQRRVEQGDPLSRAEVHSSRADAYEHYVDELLSAAVEEPDDRAALLAAAFAVAERFRARVLLESLHGTMGPGLDPGLLARICEVQRRLIDPGLGSELRAAASEELAALEREELATRTELARAQPALGLDAIELDELQALLGPHEALLVFQLATSRDFNTSRRGSWVMVVTRGAVRAVELTGVEGLPARIELFGPLVEGRVHPVDAAAGELWAALLADALAELPAQIDALHLVLDGAMHRLAFPGLRPEPGAPALIERYAVSVLPSASVLGLWRRRGREGPAGQSVLALADPKIVGAPGRLYAELEGEGGAAEGLTLAALPRARREAELAAHGPADTLLLGEQADEAALVDAELDRFAVIHLATHAIIDPHHPSRSALVLARAPGEASSCPGGDGLVQPRELAALALDRKLVVLSACSSVGDRIIEGEGIMGLAHALFEAGAHVVVGSLWPLRDGEALALFERFYVHLDAGLSVAAALAAAQRDRAAAGAVPAAWAGVVALGDGSFVPFPGGRAPASSEASRVAEAGCAWGPAAGVGLLLLSALGLVGWRRRRRG